MCICFVIFPSVSRCSFHYISSLLLLFFWRHLLSSLTRQEIPRLLLNPMFHCCAHNSPTTCPYNRPDESSPHILIFLMSITILSYHLRLGLPSGLYPSGPPSPKYLYPFLFSPCVLHVPPVSYSLFRSPEKPVRGKNHSAPHNATLSSLLLLRPSWARATSAAPSSRTPAAYVFG